MDRLVDKATKAKLEPTTAESLTARAGVVAIDFCHRGVSVRQWGLQGFATPPWATIARLAVDLAKNANVDLMRVHLGDDAQTIRVLVDGDDALVVVYTSECTYHKSMARAMRRVLRVLMGQRKAAEVRPVVAEQRALVAFHAIGDDGGHCFDVYSAGAKGEVGFGAFVARVKADNPAKAIEMARGEA